MTLIDVNPLFNRVKNPAEKGRSLELHIRSSSSRGFVRSVIMSGSMAHRGRTTRAIALSPTPRPQSVAYNNV